jgi:site-specific DNA recombinase
MRAVIYARYSSDHQRAASIEDQVRICKERVTREGWELVQVFQDRAMSGASTAMRAGYQALLAGGRDGAFEVVVAEALDRLSRDQEDVAGLFKRLRFGGIRIVTLAEGEVSELHVGLKGTMNALFLRDLAAKTHRGMRGRVEAGMSGGGLTYGYTVKRSINADGTMAKGEREVHEAEADIVRGIFQQYGAGVSPKKIALSLNARGVMAPRGGAWTASTINGNRARGTGILNNDLYVGRLVWNRLTYMKDPESGRRRSRARQDADIVIKQVPELRIVTDDLWEVARQRQRRLDACAAGTAPAGADKHLESAAIDPKLSNRFQLRLLRNLGASSACTQAANQ